MCGRVIVQIYVAHRTLQRLAETLLIFSLLSNKKKMKKLRVANVHTTLISLRPNFQI